MSRRFILPPPPPTPSADAFVLVPLPCVAPPEAAQRDALYHCALAEALAAAAPSLPERDLLAVWN
jgi:hypothetical protein